MRTAKQFGAIFLLLSFGSTAGATSYAPKALADLFREADVVAVVRIVAGTAEGFESVVYVGEVTDAVKGLHAGERLVFGPYARSAIGGEYLLFLNRSQQTLGDLKTTKTIPDIADGRSPFYEVAFVGFGSMEVEYTCAFETCTYCIDVPISHVTLPDQFAIAPYDDPRDRASEHTWARKADLLRQLRALAESQRARE